MNEDISLKLDSKPAGVRVGTNSRDFGSAFGIRARALVQQVRRRTGHDYRPPRQRTAGGAAYQAIVPLAAIPGTLKPGVRG